MYFLSNTLKIQTHYILYLLYFRCNKWASATKINYIITQVIPIILFAIFHRYTDNVTTKTTCFVMIFRHGKTMPLKTSRLITLSFILFFFSLEQRTMRGCMKKERVEIGRMNYILFRIINRWQWYQGRPTEFWVNLASTTELTERTMPASAIYCKSIALTRPLWHPRAFTRPRQTIPSNRD